MIFAFFAAGAIQVPDDVFRTLPHVFEHYVCVADLADSAALVPGDERQDAEMISAALKTCAKTHDAALVEFEHYGLQQPNVIAWAKHKSASEIRASSENGLNSSLLDQIKKNMARIRAEKHAQD